ncbi:MAG: hypothetical protein ACI9F9_002811 [Candidatus Paceibacteria bacterium]|jgi:hypothetical protein
MNPTEANTNLKAPLDCEGALVCIRFYARGELEPDPTRILRLHLAQCPACMTLYRDTMETTALMGRRNQGEREERALERAQKNLHEKHFGPRPNPGKGMSRYKLRLLLMPAFAIFLLIHFTGLGEPPARVDLIATDGLVKVNGVLRAHPEKPFLILPGRWVTTGQFGKAVIDGGSCLLNLGQETDCLVEAARPVRVRLERGRIDLDGELIVVTVLGLLHVRDGKGRVYVDEQGLHFEPESGDWKFLDKTGEHDVDPSRRTTILPDLGIASSSAQ